jgi:hypothetical protein
VCEAAGSLGTSDGSETPLQSGITGAAFNDTSAVPGVSYTYAVRAVAAAGDSPLSGSNAGNRQMSAPTGLQASDGTLTTRISLSWNAVPGAVSCQVFRGATPVPTGTTGTSFEDGGSAQVSH